MIEINFFFVSGLVLYGAIAVSDPPIFIADRQLRLFATSRLLHQLVALGA